MGSKGEVAVSSRQLKRRLTLFGHLVRMDESTDARRILTMHSNYLLTYCVW